MPRSSAMRRLLVFLALCLAGAIFADPGMAQPVGGPTTGGNDHTGGNTAGGNTTGGNTTGGNVNTGGNVGVNVGEERRFTVEFDNFIVLDETDATYVDRTKFSSLSERPITRCFRRCTATSTARFMRG
jgi:hypothetical protein